MSEAGKPRLCRVSGRDTWHIYHQRKRISTGCTDRASAELVLARYAAELSRPTTRAVSVTEILSLYLQDRREALKPGAERLGWAHKPVSAWFGEKPPEAVTDRECRAYAQKRMESGIAASTARTEMQALRAALRWAASQKIIAECPNVPLPSRSPPKERWLTRDEAHALIDGCEAFHIRLFVILALGTYSELAFTFAGNADLIADWKEWIKAGMPGLPAIPDTQRACPGGAISMAVCCAHTTSNRVIVAHGCTPFQSKVYFAGSGTVHARVCWSVNGDARRAVESAMKMDHFSGGSVKYLAFSTTSHNLRETSDRTGLKRALKEKGMVMYHANQNQPIVVPVSDAMKTDPEIKQVMDDLQAGTRSLSAPCESMYEPWTEEERNKFGHELLDLIK